MDEQIAPSLARALRLRGVDVTTSEDAGLNGATDSQQLDFAHEQGRVIVTFDKDFLRLHHAGMPHHGVLFCPSGTHTLGSVLNLLELYAHLATPQEMRNRLEYL